MLTKILSGLMRVVLQTFGWMPRRFNQAVGRLIGHFHHLTKSRSYIVTEENIRLCLPALSDTERAELVKQSLLATGQTMMETASAWLGRRSVLEAWIVEVNSEALLMDALQSGRGLVVILPHIGNWELFNLYCARLGPQAALYQPPRQRFMRPIMEYVRGKFGHEIVPTDSKGLMRLYKILKTGGRLVAVLPDQVPMNGIFVPFFGHETLSDKLISRLVKKTNATVIAAAVLRRADGTFSINFLPARPGVYDADVNIATLAVNQTVEDCVRLAPAQYQWEYKRFRERPPGAEKLYRFGKPAELHS